MPQVDVRLTIRPDETVRVSEDAVPQLRHQGLLLGEPVPVSAAAEDTTEAGQPPADDEGNTPS